MTAEKKKIKITYTDNTGKVEEVYQDAIPYHIHPLLGSGFNDGYKKGIEAYKSALRNDIEKEKEFEMKDDFDRGYKAALNFCLEKIDTVLPNNPE